MPGLKIKHFPPESCFFAIIPAPVVEEEFIESQSLRR